MCLSCQSKIIILPGQIINFFDVLNALPYYTDSQMSSGIGFNNSKRHSIMGFNGSQMASRIGLNNSRKQVRMEFHNSQLLHTAVISICVGVYVLVILVGILGNLTTICCIYKQKQFWRHTYFCMVSTAAADMLLCCVLPFNILHLVTGQQTIHWVLCQLEAYVSYFALCSNTLSIAFTGFCRYIQVVHCSRIHIFKKPGFLMFYLLYAWLIPPLTMIPRFANSTEKVEYYENISFACRINDSLTIDSLFLKWNFVFISTPTIVSMIYFYTHICITLRRSRARISAVKANEFLGKTENRLSKAQYTKNTDNVRVNARNVGSISQTLSANAPSTSQMPGGLVDTSQSSSTKQEKRLTLCILITSVGYVVIWIIMGTLQLIKRMVEQKAEVAVMATMVVRVGPMIDVIITYILNTKLRAQALQLLGKK